MKKANQQYISVYVRNSQEGPSCYYRIVQYIDNLEEYEFKIHDAVNVRQFKKNINICNKLFRIIYQIYLYVIIYMRRFKSILYDLYHKPRIIIVQREVMPRYMPKLIFCLLKRLFKGAYIIWDFDDNILESKEISKKEFKLLEDTCKKIIVTSCFLKELISEKNQFKAELLPTTDGFANHADQDKIVENRFKSYETHIKIAWVGTAGNLPNIKSIIDKLDSASERIYTIYGKTVELYIVCNKPFEHSTSFLKIYNIKWTRKMAEKVILDAHIGIMPLLNTVFNIGKGGFKLVQYISTGLPVIASDVGYNREIVNESVGFLISERQTCTWENALEEISIDFEKWLKYSEGAINTYYSTFSYSNNLNKWRNYLK